MAAANDEAGAFILCSIANQYHEGSLILGAPFATSDVSRVV
jgi:hypothetical protein